MIPGDDWVAVVAAYGRPEEQRGVHAWGLRVLAWMVDATGEWSAVVMDRTSTTSKPEALEFVLDDCGGVVCGYERIPGDEDPDAAISRLPDGWRDDAATQLEARRHRERPRSLEASAGHLEHQPELEP